jgi:hypothetical protein
VCARALYGYWTQSVFRALRLCFAHGNPYHLTMHMSVAASMLLLAGCSLLIDPDTLKAGPAPQGDAAIQAGLEAGIESGGIGDGGTGATADAPSGNPCSTSHLWCENFEAAALDPLWKTTQEVGTLLRTAAAPRRPGTRALEVRKTQPTKAAVAFLERSVDAARVRCEVDYYFETAPEVSTFYNVISKNPAPQTFYQVSLSHEGAGLVSFGARADPGPVFSEALPRFKSLATARWVHFVHTYDSKQSVADFDGTRSTFASTAAPVDGKSWALRIGVTYEETPKVAWALFIDNAFCDAL